MTLTLPAPELTEPRLDPDRSRVYDRDRGVLDRLEDAVSDTPGDEQPLYQLAEKKLAAAAAADPQLLPTAERNTARCLAGSYAAWASSASRSSSARGGSDGGRHSLRPAWSR